MSKKINDAIRKANDYSAKRRAYRKRLEEEEAKLAITAPVVVGKGRYADSDDESELRSIRSADQSNPRSPKIRPMGEYEFKEEMKKPWKRED